MARIPGTANGERLDGFPEDDRILGFGGDDSLFGYQGNDVLIGHGGNDTLHGGPGRDRLKGGGGNDLLFGDEDNDLLLGQSGKDQLQGGSGGDELKGGGGRDLLLGDEGDDTLRGGGGFDELQGGPGDDRLEGGKGFDRLFGEAGNDTLVGGAGEDRFVVESVADGLNDILDFSMDEFDRLIISTALNGFESGADFIGDFVRVEQSGDDTLVLINPDGAGSDFTPVFRLVDQIIDSDNLTTYGMTYKPIEPSLLPLRSNPSLSTDAGDASIRAAISADGRLVAFESRGNVDQSDGDSRDLSQDIFIKDFATGTVVRASVNASGELADNSQNSRGADVAIADSFAPAISSDARFAAFESDADNLVPDDTNQSVDVFVKDVLSGEVVRASTASDGAQAVDSGGAGIFGYLSSNASLSGDGHLIAFQSTASNLVAFDPNGFGSDVFMKNLSTGETQRINAPDGNLARDPVLSEDGSTLVFETFELSPGPSGPTIEARNIALTDLSTGRSTIVAPAAPHINDAFSAGGSPFGSTQVDISEDGRFVVFASEANLDQNDTNGQVDIYIYDQLLGTRNLVSSNSAGEVASGIPEFSTLLSLNPSVSDDGRFVAFESNADNLVSGDTNGLSDIFVKDTLTGLINRVSLNADGSQITDTRSFFGAFDPSISGDGRSVAFSSGAQSLQPEDTDGDVGETVFLTSTGFGASGPASIDPLLAPIDPAAS